MSGIETEIERIEESLDGAMGEDEAAMLRERIAAEPALAEMMGRVRGERGARAAVYAGLEPSDAEAQALADQIISTARRSVPPQYRVPWRSAIAVAAFMVIGFFAGWAWRGGVRRSAGVSPNHGVTTPAVASYRVALTDDQGRVTAVQDFDSLEKAREFTHDVDQWQARQRQMRDGAAVIVADQF
jgi:anti-sigma factor RsiW